MRCAERAAIGFADVEKQLEIREHLLGQALAEMRGDARQFGRAWRMIVDRRRRDLRGRFRRDGSLRRKRVVRRGSDNAARRRGRLAVQDRRPQIRRDQIMLLLGDALLRLHRCDNGLLRGFGFLLRRVFRLRDDNRFRARRDVVRHHVEFVGRHFEHRDGCRLGQRPAGLHDIFVQRNGSGGTLLACETRAGVRRRIPGWMIGERNRHGEARRRREVKNAQSTQRNHAQSSPHRRQLTGHTGRLSRYGALTG